MRDPNATTWDALISAEMDKHSETWADVEACTLSRDQLFKSFDAGFGGTCGEPFTLWTDCRVYFPVQYDGAEWVGSAPRNPNGIPTPHVGGG